jgi:hypothetical protein
VNARAEAVALQREGVGPAPGPIVLFEDQDLFTSLCQRDRCGQPTRT